MQPAAIITFILVAGFVWGGFLLIAGKAVREEGRKAEKG